MGFGAVLACVLRAHGVPVRVVELDEHTLRAPAPPAECPTCGHAALHPVRDPGGLWTWACLEGCNP